MARSATRGAVTDAGHGRAVLALVDQALDALDRAVDDVPAFRCGTTTVRIRTTGAHGRDHRPFSHLPAVERRDASANGVRGLAVHACDGPFPAADGDRPPPGHHRVRDGRLFVTVTDEPPTVNGVRHADGRAMSWIDDAAHAPPYTRFRPFADIFSAWFPVTGMSLLHAAAVGDAEGVALLVGNGGSGKSTTSVLCSRAGLGFLADDFCLLEPGTPPRVHSIYRSAKLRHDSMGLVPGVEVAPGAPVDDDHYLLVDEDATIVSAPVRAVIAVRPAVDVTAAPRLEHVARDEIFRLLLPTALKVATGGDVAYRSWLRAAHVIADTLPAFTLDLTWETSRVVDLVRDALDARSTPNGST